MRRTSAAIRPGDKHRPYIKPSVVRHPPSVIRHLTSVPCPLKPGNCLLRSAVFNRTMNHPTHEAISTRGYFLWEQRGRPANAESEIWLAAEAQLRDEYAKADSAKRKAVPTAVVPSHAIAPTTEERQAIVDEVQKHTAWAPQTPHHTGPKATPAPPGKPIWSKPHGS